MANKTLKVPVTEKCYELLSDAAKRAGQTPEALANDLIYSGVSIPGAASLELLVKNLQGVLREKHKMTVPGQVLVYLLALDHLGWLHAMNEFEGDMAAEFKGALKVSDDNKILMHGEQYFETRRDEYIAMLKRAAEELEEEVTA